MGVRTTSTNGATGNGPTPRMDGQLEKFYNTEFNAGDLNQEHFNTIIQLPEILSNDEELETGEFDLGIFKIRIKRIKTYEKENIYNS